MTDPRLRAIETTFQAQTDAQRTRILLDPLLSPLPFPSGFKDMYLRLSEEALKSDDGVDLCNTTHLSARLAHEYLAKGVVNFERFVTDVFGGAEWQNFFEDITVLVNDAKQDWKPSLPLSTHTSAGYFGVETARRSSCSRRGNGIAHCLMRKPRGTDQFSVPAPTVRRLPPQIENSRNAVSSAPRVQQEVDPPRRALQFVTELAQSDEKSNDEDLVTDGRSLAFVFGANGLSLVKQGPTRAPTKKALLSEKEKGKSGGEVKAKKTPPPKAVMNAAKLIAVEAKPATPPPLPAPAAATYSQLTAQLERPLQKPASSELPTVEDIRALIEALPLHVLPFKARAAALVGIEGL